MNIHLELCLFVLIGFAHKGKAFIGDAPGNIVLIDADKQSVKLRNATFCLCKLRLVATKATNFLRLIAFGLGIIFYCCL